MLLKSRGVLTSLGCTVISVKKIDLDGSFSEMNTALGKMCSMGDGRKKTPKIDPMGTDKVNNPFSSRHIIHFV